VFINKKILLFYVHRLKRLKMYFVTIGGDNFRTRSKTHNYVPPFINTMYKGIRNE